MKSNLFLIGLFSLVSLAPAFGKSTAEVKLVSDYAKYTESELSKTKAVEEWNSVNGIKLFTKAEFPNDFYRLAPFYQPQINPAYCGVATLTIIRNYFEAKNFTIPNNTSLALDIHQPENAIFKMPYFSYSQITFFDDKAISKIKSKEHVTGANKKPPFDPGVNLDEFSAIAHAVNLTGEAVNVDIPLATSERGYETFIANLKEATSDEKKILVANFRGKIYGGLTGGHISPIVALSYDQDRKDYYVLILDVAAHKNPWTWVAGKDFYNAMNSIDTRPSGVKKNRGYIVLSHK